jgi:phosphonate metabolism-associated iron-containing alcohol dehydrogenase
MIQRTASNHTTIIEGSINQLKGLVSKKSNVLLITTTGFKNRGTSDSVILAIGNKKIHVMEDVSPNPTVAFVNSLIMKYYDYQFDCIIAIGGGSVIDVGKILAATLRDSKPYQLSTSDISLSTIKRNSRKISLIAIPTTSGSGAEVTPFTTIWDDVEHKKYSWNTELLYPEIALLDPELVRTLPKTQTIYCAMDTISHSLESIWNKNATNKSRFFAVESLRISSKYLPLTIDDLNNLTYRRKLQLSSTMAGMAISITKTAIAHSISYPLTAKLGIPHGLASSFTLEKILQDHIAIISKNEAEFKLFCEILNVIKRLNLKNEMNKFSSKQAILDLSIEMRNKDRFKNFSGVEYDIDKLINASLL